MAELDGKVVMVTGATRGIGLAAAERLAADGARVVLTARDRDAGQRVEAAFHQSGHEALFVAADMTHPDGPATVVAAALDRYGRLDGALNNVGGVTAYGGPEDVEPDAWHAELALNLTSVYLCLRAQLPALIAAGGGSVVNNASIAGTIGIPGLAAYVAAKHGVVGLTRSVALQHAAQSVRVNALITGNVDTPLYREMLGAAPEAPRGDLDAPNPSRRVAGPAEVAAFVAYLLSDDASFITGASLPIDGGATAG